MIESYRHGPLSSPIVTKVRITLFTRILTKVRISAPPNYAPCTTKTFRLC